ncbi:MAG: S49 family peptidase [Planctomycetota bacterium]
MNVLEFFASKRWALERSTFEAIQRVLVRHASGERLDREAITAIVAESPARQREAMRQERTGIEGIAVVPIHGVISKRASLLAEMSHMGTSVETIRAKLAEAIEDTNVSAIVLDMDSPGGSTDGIDELAQAIRDARGAKPIIAHVEGLMASAALWIGVQADEVYATHTSEIGSIGVYWTLIDSSKAHEKAGMRVDVVSSGGQKGALVPGVEISKETRAEVQASVDEFTDLFVEAVSEGRGMEADDVRKLADGRVHLAPKAEELGLIDGVRSFQGVVEALQGDEMGTRVISPVTSTDMTKTQNEASAPATAAELEKAFPGLVAEIRDGVRKEAHEEGVKAGAEEESKRAQRILKAATKSQTKLASDLIAEGVDLDEALDRLAKDPHRESSQKLDDRMKASGEDTDGSKEAVDEDEDEDDEEEDDEGEDFPSSDKSALKAKWKKSKALRADFPEFADYAAFAKHDKKGGR